VINPPGLTPQQRLANSRQAIVRHMGHTPAAEEEGFDELPAEEGEFPIDTSAGTWNLAKQVGRAWWRGHPAHLAVDLATPVLQTYAEKNPLQLLGISAGIGAAAVVLRPWRLMSFTGLLVAALKSPEIANVARSLLSPEKKPDRHR
jgi:hypothetical protein